MSRWLGEMAVGIGPGSCRVVDWGTRDDLVVEACLAGLLAVVVSRYAVVIVTGKRGLIVGH
ncbi:hypothetical protein [Haloarcula sp. JP-L23]|uniref:hypothetical protein n=1 Tax=Haloarcula sp. JP-L23 TaxID=2716717 RepID=UPI00140F21DA|nr:hypothetical protein G9465_23655 [Haloarcula sp. JP-L23]